MRVCLETFLLQNMAMDALVLALGLRLAGRRLRPWRLLSASALGTAYGVLSYLKPLLFLRGAAFQVLCVVLMCALTLPRPSPKEFLSLTAFCYLATALLGGIGFGLLGQMGSRGFTWLHAVLTALLGGVGLAVLSDRLREQKRSPNCRAQVRLRCGRTELCLEGFTDTGNALTEPLSGLPVMLVSAELFSLPDGAKKRPVPFEAMGRKGIVDACWPDALRVDGEKKDWFVAVYPGKLPCGALLPPESTLK